MPNAHAGPANSADIGQTAAARPSAARYRFHQPVLSDTKYSELSDDQAGWTMDSPTPPATSRMSVRPPSAEISAVYSRVPSQGMFGWSQASQARRRPSGLSRGELKKS